MSNDEENFACAKLSFASLTLINENKLGLLGLNYSSRIREGGGNWWVDILTLLCMVVTCSIATLDQVCYQNTI